MATYKEMRKRFEEYEKSLKRADMHEKNTGFLFVDTRKKEGQPDMLGTINVEGELKNISLWWKKGKAAHIKIRERTMAWIWHPSDPNCMLHPNAAEPQKPTLIGIIDGKYIALWKGKTQFGNDKYMVILSKDKSIYDLEKTVPLKGGWVDL